MKLLLMVAVLVLTMMGCTSRKITYGDVTYDHRSFGTTTSFGKLMVTHPNGLSVQVENFANDQVGALREVHGILQEANKLKAP